MEDQVIESVLEGILFAAGEPVEIQRLAKAMAVEPVQVEDAAKHLADCYRFERRGIRLLRLDNAYQLTTAPEHADIIRRVLETRRPSKLSPALLEVLSLVAYFQPTTRGYVEQVRGVDSSYSFRGLLERGLIEEAGKLSVPGRPTLFRTTALFLKTFHLASLEELPPLPEETKEGQMKLSLKQVEEAPGGGERS